ncbi:MAG: hypothetical protein AAFV90_23175 [Cyanobacteria bacterium J06634_5]
MPTTKANRLLALEQTLSFSGGKSFKRSSHSLKKLKYQHRTSPARRRKTQVKAQAFDYDEPIELTYRDDTNSYVPGMDYDAGEDTSEDDYEASAFDWDEDEDDYGDEASDEASAFDWDEDEDDYEASAFDWDEDDDEDAEAFEVETFEVEAFEVDDDEDEGDLMGSETFSAIALDEEDLAEDLDFSDLDAALDEDISGEAASEAFSETDFAKDLQAIMSGEKTYDKDRGGMVSADDELATAKSQTPDAALASEDSDNPHDVFSQMSEHMPHNQMSAEPLAQVGNEAVDLEQAPHDVFDRMGHNMSYANSFDLGSISLEQRFDAFDEAIDRAAEKLEAKHQAIQSKKERTAQALDAPLALDDVALVADLALMQETMANDEDNGGEGHHAESDDDAPDQAIQFSTEPAWVVKPGGATIYKYQKDDHGLSRAVETGRVVKPAFGDTISVDMGAELTRNNRKYVLANAGGKIGYIRKDNVLPKSFNKLSEIVDHPRVMKALRAQAKSQDSEGEINFYLAVDELEPDDQAGAIRIFDRYLLDEDDETATKIEDLNKQLKTLNPKINPEYLLKEDAPAGWRKTVNVGSSRAAIHENFPQLVYKNRFQKALFFHYLRNADDLKAKLASGLKFKPKLINAENEKAQENSVLKETVNNLRSDMFQSQLKGALAANRFGDIEALFNL